jgi:excisionase family DNA binding protein
MRPGEHHMADDILLTVEEVSRRLGVHMDTIRRWIRRGELPAISLGGSTGYRIAKADLEHFIQVRRTDYQQVRV